MIINSSTLNISSINPKKILFLSLLLLILLILNFYFYIIYPSISDFDYWHMRAASIIDNSGHITFDQTDIAYYLTINIICSICGISYQELPLSPILLISMTAIVFSVFFRFSNSILIGFLVTITYLIFSTNPIMFTIGMHEMGLLLLLTILLLVLIRNNANIFGKIQISRSSSILIIFILILLNLYSYKLTFVAIFILGFYFIIDTYYYRENKFNNKSISVFTIFLIGCIIVFSFNKFIYNHFLPVLSDPELISSTTGIFKLMLQFSGGSETVSNQFLYSNPTNLLLFKILYYGIVIFIVISFISVYIIFRKKTNSLSIKIAISFCFAGLAILLIYSIIGLADSSILLISGFVLTCVVYKESKRKTKRNVFIVTIVLLIICVTINLITIDTNHYSGQKTESGFDYLHDPSGWYIEKTDDNYATDVLTMGYIILEGSTNYPNDVENVHVINVEENTFIRLRILYMMMQI